VLVALLSLLWIEGIYGGYKIGSYSISVTDPKQDKTVSGIVHYPILTGPKETFPLLVFSPGFIFRDTFYDYLWQALVPLGYVMVVGGTYDYDPFSEPLGKAKDQAFFLDYLTSQSQTNKNSPVYSLIGNTSAVMGHSEGGLASLIAADPKLLNNTYINNFTTIVDLSGCFPPDYDYPTYGVKHEKIPILFLTGDKDCICTDKTSFYFYSESISPCKYYVDITDGSHCFFANPGPVDAVLCFDLEVLDGCGFVTKLPKDTQLQLVAQMVVPWLQWHLKGITSNKGVIDSLLQTDKQQGKLTYQSAC